MTESKILLQKASLLLGIVFFLLAIFLIDVFLLSVAGVVLLFLSPLLQIILELKISLGLLIYFPVFLLTSLLWSYIIFITPRYLDPFWKEFEKLLQSFKSSEFVTPPKLQKGGGLVPMIFYIPSPVAIIINILLILAVIYYISFYNVDLLVKIFLEPPIEWVAYVHTLFVFGIIMRNKKMLPSVSN